MARTVHLEVFLLLQVLDVTSTAIGLRSGLSESNPGVAGPLALGWGAFIAMKVLLAGGVLILLLRHGGPFWDRTMMGLNLPYAAIVGWNLGLMLAWPFTGALLGAALIGVIPIVRTLAHSDPAPGPVPE